jgi:hypothetical protein
MKFVVPLLKYLGFDRLEDMDFEVNGIDVRLSAHGRPTFLVECKAWEELATDHLNQCLEYTLTSGIPHIFITSGQWSALYSGLLDRGDLRKTQPIIKFRFTELRGENGQAILEQLHQFISKESFLRGAKALERAIEARLPKTQSLDDATNKFLLTCKTFRKQSKTYHMTEEEFCQKAARHAPEVTKALTQLMAEIGRIGAQGGNAYVRYRSKEIGLGYELDTKPRPKKLGLFGVYPKTAHVAFGVQNWKRLGVSKATLGLLENQKALRRRLESREQAGQIVRLLHKAFDEIGGR